MLEFIEVYKRYGRIEALRGVSFRVNGKFVAALLGPNGAGKTTIMKITMGFVKPDSGTVRVLSMDPFVEEDRVRSLIGYLPEKPIYPLKIRVKDLLYYLARIRGIGENDVNRVIKLVGLEDYSDREIKSLSRGYLQRLGLAQALLGDPQLLLLDEPTANLDPMARQEILRLLNILHRDLDVSMVISSHIIPELQEVANYAIFIDRGVILDHGSLEDLAKRYNVKSIMFIETTNTRKLISELSSIEFIEGINIVDNGIEIKIDSRNIKAVERYLDELIKEGIIRSYRYKTAQLSDIYEKLTSGKH